MRAQCVSMKFVEAFLVLYSGTIGALRQLTQYIMDCFKSYAIHIYRITVSFIGLVINLYMLIE